MTLAITASDKRLWLTVAATPSAFPVLPAGKRGPWGNTYLTGIHAPRYPWEVVLSRCTPGRPHRMQGDVVNLDDLYGMCDGDRNFWDRPVKQEVPILLTDDEGQLAQAKLKEMLGRIEAATEAAMATPTASIWELECATVPNVPVASTIEFSMIARVWLATVFLL